MLFFKSFSLLHRRTKSDGNLTQAIPSSSAVIVPTPSAVYAPSSILNNSTCVAIASPTPSQTTVLEIEGKLSKIPPPLIQSFIPFDYSKSNQKVSLLTENLVTSAELGNAAHNAAGTRTSLYSEMVKTAWQSPEAAAQAEVIRQLETRLIHCRKIEKLLADVGLNEAVLSKALRQSESGGYPAEILGAALHHGNLSNDERKFVGPRDPEHYMALLEMTLKTRKELRGRKKFAKFWKRAAQQDGRHATTITPSASDISSIQETLTFERQQAVEALVTKRAATNPRSAISMVSLSSTAIIPEYREGILTPKESMFFKNETSNFVTSPTSESSASGNSSVTLSPLASQVMKHQVGLQSKKRLSSRRYPDPAKTRSMALHQRDLNIPANAHIHRPAVIQPTRVTTVHRRYPSVSSRMNSRSFVRQPHTGRSDASTTTPTPSFVTALSESLRKVSTGSSRRSQVTHMVKAQRLMHLGLSRSREDLREGIPFDNAAFQVQQPRHVPTSITDNRNASQVGCVTPTPTPDSGSRFSERIAKETMPPDGPTYFEHGESLGHISEESDDNDVSFEFETRDSLSSTGPTTPSKSPGMSITDTQSLSRISSQPKSKLPVFKYLRRLSPQSGSEKLSGDSVTIAPMSKTSDRRRGRSGTSTPTPSRHLIDVFGSEDI